MGGRGARVGEGAGRRSACGPADVGCLIAGLNERIDAALRPVVPRKHPYALVDFPNTSNVGDSAIWLGELAWLRRNGFGEPLYTCSSLSFSPRAMRRRVPSGTTILLSGGGNFGDLYLNHQRLRETIVRKFADCRIVQLPQSIHYQTEAAVERTRCLYDEHPDLTIFTRDPRSFDLVRSTFRAAVHMCPDMALCLGPIARPERPTKDVVWLARRDRETLQPELCTLPAGVARLDWLKDDITPLFRWNRLLRFTAGRWPRYRVWLQTPLSRTYEALARERLWRGLRILGDGHTVITDRLHGHILSLLLGIPHVLLDNSYGKIRRFHEAWTSESPLVQWSEDPEEALHRALAARRG